MIHERSVGGACRTPQPYADALWGTGTCAGLAWRPRQIAVGQVRHPLQARPTTYKGIAMRSRLEARMAAQLDRAGWTWVYEPRAYASEEGQWLPDFEVMGPVLHHFLEVKPTKEAAVNAVDRVRVIFASEPDTTVGIMWPVSEDGWGIIAIRRDALSFGEGIRQVGEPA